VRGRRAGHPFATHIGVHPSEELPETITNPPEVTEIIPQRLIDSGFKINRLKNAENAGGTTGWVRTTK
jgi:hypothetical protein